MKFEYWKAPAGNWSWHLKTDDGEKIAHGEGYRDKTDVLFAIDLEKSSGTAPVVNLTPEPT